MTDADRAFVQARFGTIWAGNGPEFKVTCTACGRKALWVNTEKEVFHCFVCGYSGRLEHALGTARLVNGLAGTGAGASLRSLPSASEAMVMPPRYTEVRQRSEAPDAWDYVSGRGVDPETVEFGVYESLSVCFPARENGRIVYWQSRAIDSHVKRKTNNPSRKVLGYGKESVVYRLDSIVESAPAIVVEGVFDALRTGAVATYGKLMSITQAMKIGRRRPSVVFVCYDPDAWEFSLKAADLIYSVNYRVPAIPIRLTGEMDPADLGRENLLDAIRQDIVNMPLGSVSSTRLALLGVSRQELLIQLRDSPAVW